jgi:PTS system N-acetylglucosamine-specific IIC component
VICFLVTTRGAAALLPPGALTGAEASAAAAAAIARLSVPIGILSGLIAGGFYNRFATIRLPDYLSFFGGRRFVPIISGFAGVCLATLVGLLYAPIIGGMDALSALVIRSGVVGLFFYGLLNRLLIFTGLHHILNNIAWFLIGDFHGVTGDLNRFFAGDPTAGAFMSGFFPIMIFGLPAAALAMYHEALPERRRAAGGALLSMSVTALLTGVTEPLEFTFMFLAPRLYLLHAVLTGTAMALMALLDVKLGFGFSAGLIDYVLSFSRATRPWLLLPVGAVYAVIYYVLFRYTVRRFDLKTPGREPADASAPAAAPAGGERGAAFVAALGGAANLVRIDACTTRLRLVLANPAAVNEPALRALGAKGFVRPSPDGLQVVLGPIADGVAMEMRAAAGSSASADAGKSVAPPVTIAPPRLATDAIDGTAWQNALGGPANVRGVRSLVTRLRVDAVDPQRLDHRALTALGVRHVLPCAAAVHLLVDDADSIAAAITA